MTEPIKFDPTRAYERAHDMARAEEERARLLLWDRITERATTDLEFRRLLAQDPKRAVERETPTLQDEAGQPITVGAGVVEAVAEKARATYSSVVPEVASQRVEELIFGTIEDIRRSFKLTLVLSQVLFYAGLAMTVAAFVAALRGGDKKISLLFGAGGIGSVIISSLVISPLDRVQNAAGNLVQLQMAYLAYYKQLYLLGPGTNPLSRDDAIAYSHEIGQAAASLMSSVQTYVEKGKGDASSTPPSQKPTATDKGEAPVHDSSAKANKPG